MEQTGASAANPEQKLFFDFLIDRSLSAPWLSLWGDVQIGSFPQQITTPIAEFNLATSIANLPVNQVAESGAFSSGIDVHPFPSWNAGGGSRRFGFVLGAGATAPLPPASRLNIFAVPDGASPQYASFIAQYPQAAGASYIGFLPPDRQQFYRNWGAGFRLTTSYSGRPAAMYTFTLGQDEQITAGNLHGAVAKFDVFYPMPVRIRGYNYLYLFATADLRMARAANTTPFILAPAPSTVSGSDPSVAIVPIASARDLYRIGVGVDAVGLICAIFQGNCQ
ncbi:MAG TPA: hypothetical protein VMB85_24270 [Bryobacteraceae bacterium]|nr:hypothetical protein [Bryobacteraceae bacterium]